MMEAHIKETHLSIQKLDDVVSAVTSDVMDVLEEDGVPQEMEFIVVAAVTKPTESAYKNEMTIITRATCDSEETDIVLAQARFGEVPQCST